MFAITSSGAGLFDIPTFVYAAFWEYIFEESGLNYFANLMLTVTFYLPSCLLHPN